MSTEPTDPAPSPSTRRTRKLVLASVPLWCGLAFYVVTIRDFLAVTRPVSDEVLVVEAWFPESATLSDAAAMVRRRNYRQIVCVAVDDPQERQAGLATQAERTARQLAEMGIKREKVQVLVVPANTKDRTFSCALAVRDWLRQAQPSIRSLDVFTKATHARKSGLFYRKAFPPEFAIGTIAGRVTGYPFSTWWLSPRGIFVTVRNTIGYLYALCFTPPPDANRTA